MKKLIIFVVALLSTSVLFAQNSIPVVVKTAFQNTTGQQADNWTIKQNVYTGTYTATNGENGFCKIKANGAVVLNEYDVPSSAVHANTKNFIDSRFDKSTGDYSFIKYAKRTEDGKNFDVAYLKTSTQSVILFFEDGKLTSRAISEL